MPYRLSFNIDHAGHYPMEAHIGPIEKVVVMAITVNGKQRRYSDLILSETDTPLFHSLELTKQNDPSCRGMLSVNKTEAVVETFKSSDLFVDDVVVTLDLYTAGEP